MSSLALETELLIRSEEIEGLIFNLRLELAIMEGTLSVVFVL